MANNDESVQSPVDTLPITGLVDPTDPTIRNVYANDMLVEIGEADISLLFSYSFWNKGDKVNKPSVRIVLTHTNFVKMVDFMQKRADLLHRAYSGVPPDLMSGDPGELESAFDELYGVKDNSELKDAL